MFHPTALNFSTIVPDGVRFYQAYCAVFDLFGLVSMGYERDRLRLAGMPVLLAEPRPRFVQSVDDAAEYLAGLLKAELGTKRLAEIRRTFASCPDEFAIYRFGDRCESFTCREAFGQAFQYASGGRELIEHENETDDLFAVALWEVFAEAFFAETVEA